MKYMEILGIAFPGVEASVSGYDYDYEDIVWSSTVISQQDLDNAWLQLARAKKAEDINQHRDFLMTQGFWFQSHLYDCDSQAKQNVTGAVTALLIGQTLPSNFVWRDKNNTNVPFNDVLLKGLGLSMMTYTSYLFEWSWNLKSIIFSMTDPAAVEAYDQTQNWPTNNFDGTGPGQSTSQSAASLMAALNGNQSS